MSRSNIPYIISYICGVAALFLLCIFYRQSLLIALLLLMLLLPVLSIAATRFAIGQLDVTLEAPPLELKLPCSMKLTLRLHNGSAFPLLNCRLRFRYENLFYPSDTIHELTLAAEANSISGIELPFSFSAAGMFVFFIESLRITDYMHLYSFKPPLSIRREFPVLPADKKLPEYVLRKAPVESEDSQPSPDGELTSELRQLREYRPGDRMRDIHWKASAKSDTMMIKEYERAKDLYYLLLPELEQHSLQDSLCTLYNLGLRLISEKEIFRIALYHPADASIDFLRVADEDTLKAAIYKLYAEPAQKSSSAYDALCRQYPDIYGVVRIHGTHILSDTMMEDA